MKNTTTTPAEMANALYIRVSTKKQANSGLGYEAQAAAIAARGFAGKEFIEAESGKRNRRPVLKLAIEYARSTGGQLIIAKLDRLARNVAFTFKIKEACERYGIQVVALDVPEFNTLNVGVVALMAEYEGARISERTAAALSVLRQRRGEWRSWAASGGASPEALQRSAATRRGWCYECEARKRAALVATQMAKGGNSLRSIARALTNSGFATSVASGKVEFERTGEWAPMQVKRLLNAYAPEVLTLMVPKMGRPRTAATL
jgi:DNA invertase Pin-like site-specific DNA recombinase